MAIVFHDSDVRGEFLDEQICFFCSQSFDKVAIMWDGSGASIWLHSDCFIKLAIRMFRDVHELEITSNNPKQAGYIEREAWFSK